MMSENWYPVILTDCCTNCRKCYDICANNVFEIYNKDEVVVAYPEDCTFECTKCQSMCLEGALLYELNFDPLN
jgi:NAD-dependent dihydropyrimidine dehydrogenase PreA subunit